MKTKLLAMCAQRGLISQERGNVQAGYHDKTPYKHGQAGHFLLSDHFCALIWGWPG